MTGRHSVIPYVGGKYDQAPWIVQHFPAGYKRYGYVEPFGGALSVFFSKQPSSVEVVNDLDDEVVNLWQVIQSEGERLAREADKLPYARRLFDAWADEWYFGQRPDDPFERALRFFYICRSGFAGKHKTKSGWAHAIQRNQARSYRTGIKEIPWAKRRLKDVQIECKDFDYVIGTYDCPDCLLYCDPPFVGSERYYTPTFTEEDHRRLAGLLREVSAKVVLSYYDDPLVRELYSDNGWLYHSRMSRKDADGRVGEGRLDGQPRQDVVEVLITNYETQLRLF